MLFLIMSNINIDFKTSDLQRRSYTIGDILLTTRRTMLIEKKEFIKVVLDLKHKVFVVHIAALSSDLDNSMYLSKRA